MVSGTVKRLIGVLRDDSSQREDSLHYLMATEIKRVIDAIPAVVPDFISLDPNFSLMEVVFRPLLLAKIQKRGNSKLQIDFTIGVAD